MWIRVIIKSCMNLCINYAFISSQALYSEIIWQSVQMFSYSMIITVWE